MPEITGVESLEAWLKTRPPEDARLIAARAALRSVPFLVSALSPSEDGEERRRTIVFPVFRGMILSFTASICGREDLVPLGTHAEIGLDPDKVYQIDNAAFAVARGVSRALNAVEEPLVADQLSAATSRAAVEAANEAGAGRGDRVREITASNFWFAVNFDAELLESGAERSRFDETPLWPDGDISPFAFDQWKLLQVQLGEANEGWEIWTRWYQDRLDGRLMHEELEVAKALIPDEIWKQGPKVLNAEIARLEAEFAGRDTMRAEVTVTDPPVLTVKQQVAEVIAARPREVSISAAEKHDLIARIIDEKRASLPNDPERLAEVEQEIATLEAMLPELAEISDEAADLRAEPSPAEVEPVAERVIDLRVHAEKYIAMIVGRRRAVGVLDIAVIGGLTAFLIFCGAPSVAAVSLASGVIAGTKLWDRIKGLIGKS